jgi:hypothetical protein
MNNDVLHSNAQVDRSIISKLFEVKETIATEIHLGKKTSRVFGINDLWNIHRNARLASSRQRRA